MIHKTTEWHRDFGSMPFLTTTQPLKEVCIMADSVVAQSRKVYKKRTRRKNVPLLCEIPGCDREYLAKGCCQLHYWRLWTGKDPSARTRFDPNEIVVSGDIAEIILYDRHGNETARTIIDTIDIPKVTDKKWCCTKSKKGATRYVVNSATGEFLHNLISPVSNEMINDHKDGDGLNNRRDNLRPATHSDNMHNSCSQAGTSKFKGVYYYKQTKKWRAQINTKHLGFFRSEEAAALAYDAAARENFGEFARLNFA
jgi:hypothetical protein